MRLELCAINFLTKWLKEDLPRLTVEPGKQVGVNAFIIYSDQMSRQRVFTETLRQSHILPRSDIALILSQLGEMIFEPQWVKNTDLSVNGHVSDAGLWVTQTLADSR